jgi:two-component system, cell cycle sensor histidine kinase and response regulator CckA
MEPVERPARDAEDGDAEYWSLFDACPIGMALLSIEGVWLRVNRRLRELLGSSEDELQGCPCLSLVPPEEQQALRLERERLVAGAVDRLEAEHRYRRRDGTYIWVHSHAQVRRAADGTPAYLIEVVEDVSARRAAEEQVRRTAEQLQAVIASLPIALWALDRHGLITLSEGRLLGRFGFRPGELIGRSALEMYGEDQEVGRQLRRAVAGETVHFTNEYDGGVFDVWYSPLLDEHQRPAGTIGIALDITERVQLEEQVRQAQKMEAVGRLAGGIAHDFNNLLTAIIGYAELALGVLPPDSAARLDVQEILTAGRSAASLTRQLLAFSRRQELEPQVVSLNEIVSRISGLLRRLLGQDITLRTELDPELAAVYADPGQMEQIVMNLAVNARDAMPGGGLLTIETRNVTDDAGRRVLLAITDTGTGMSPEVQSRVFEPFFTTKERGEGTGLGLATVYGVVNQSGGSIRVESEPGRGTRFEILLPSGGARVGSAGVTP